MVTIKGTMITLHGPPKVGKTQFVSSMDEPVQFIATEYGHKFIPESQRKRVIQLTAGREGWDKFIRMLKERIIIRRKCGTVAVDTTGKLYERCMEWVCHKKNWEHPSDQPHGKGWHAVRLEFARALEKLADQCAEVDATLVFIDHTDVEEVSLTTKQFHKMKVAMPGTARNVVLPASDHIFFLGYDHHEDADPDSLSVEGHSRILWVGGTESIEAGTRDSSLNAKKVRKIPKTNPYQYFLSVLNKENSDG